MKKLDKRNNPRRHGGGCAFLISTILRTTSGIKIGQSQAGCRKDRHTVISTHPWFAESWHKWGQFRELRGDCLGNAVFGLSSKSLEDLTHFLTSKCFNRDMLLRRISADLINQGFYPR